MELISRELREMVNSFSYRILPRATRIEPIKECLRDVKYKSLKTEQQIVCKGSIKEALSGIRNYCIELAQQICSLIQSVESAKDETEDYLSKFHTNRIFYDGEKLNITNDIILQLDYSMFLDSIANNSGVVRKELFRNKSKSSVTKENIIGHIAHNCACVNIDFNTLLANSGIISSYLLELYRRSDVLINLDSRGENILHNESIVIVTPHVLAPIVQNIMEPNGY